MTSGTQHKSHLVISATASVLDGLMHHVTLIKNPDTTI